MHHAAPWIRMMLPTIVNVYRRCKTGDTETTMSARSGRGKTVVEYVVTAASILVAAGLLARILMSPSVDSNILPRSIELATPVLLDSRITLGNPNAKLGIVIFSDFQCPYCAEFARVTIPQLEHEYVRVGTLLLAFKHLPLTTIHPQAIAAAEAAECAGLQVLFWPMHDQLVGDQQHFEPNSLSEKAQIIGAN